MTSKNSAHKARQLVAFDTTAYSHLVRGNDEVSIILRAASTIVIPLPTVVELKTGFAFGSRQQENNTQLVRFISSDKMLVVCPSEITAEYYVALFTHARHRGRQLSHNDLWIAALAMQHGSTLITFDRDFEGVDDFKGLQLQILKEN